MLRIFRSPRSAAYLQKAYEVRDRAKLALTREAAKELYELAERYTRLAERTDRNDGTETPQMQ
jgi:hypothetical protein